MNNKNFRTFKVTGIAATNTKPRRIKIQDLWFGDKIYLSASLELFQDCERDDALYLGLHWLASNGFPIVGTTATTFANGTNDAVIVDDFEKRLSDDESN
jgi:hypothetical protein